MGIPEEHLRMKPVLEKADEFDIRENPDPCAIYELGKNGFHVWCTPEDHPEGWDGVPKKRGTYPKPCEYVASIRWGWELDVITHLEVTTPGNALKDSCVNSTNRLEDISWTKEKVRWLFEQAGVPMPELRVTDISRGKSTNKKK